MSRWCFLIAIGLLCVQPSESAASIQWEFECVGAGMTGTIVLDETYMVPGAVIGGGAGDGLISINFTDYLGRQLSYRSGTIIRLGADPFDLTQVRLDCGFDDPLFFVTGTSPNIGVRQFFSPGFDPRYRSNPNWDESLWAIRAGGGTLRLAGTEPVPEPATLAVWSLLIATVGGVYWKRRG